MAPLTQPAKAAVIPNIDTESFRLSAFIDLLKREDELEVVTAATDLIDVAARLDGNSKAVLFEKAGEEQARLVGNVMGSRRRMALAFGVSEKALLTEVLQRSSAPIPPVRISSGAAPVHQVVLQGDKADFTRLPVHLQHVEDGAPYISAGIDISRSIDGSKRNVGYRRLMLRGPREAGVDMIAPSDFRVMYADYLARKERMPVAFVIGSHPADGVAATAASTEQDELALMGGLRKAPVPVVQCVSIDLEVPADAEMVLEGYLDESGWAEHEGPYGEYVGYYGRMKTNPVFHLTAITMRRDALFQTITIGGRFLAATDTAQLVALRTEAAVWQALRNSISAPVAVHATPSSGGQYNVRLSLRQRYPGEGRNAIHCVLGSNADVKHLFVVDDDIDVFSDAQMNWALATRFQANRDLVVAEGFRTIPLDPSLLGSRTGAKAGFDLTFPFGWQATGEYSVPSAPVPTAQEDKITVRQALESGPKTFFELVTLTGSRDGRDVVRALDVLRKENGIGPTETGQYTLQKARQQ
jgi:2,5-furandicarboxylate decarboxylase 1